MLFTALAVFPTNVILRGDGVSSQLPILQDEKTGMFFYVESDRRHIAAISPTRKLLWCKDAFPILKGHPDKLHIESVKLGDGFLLIRGSGNGIGSAEATIETKTGELYTFVGI